MVYVYSQTSSKATKNDTKSPDKIVTPDNRELPPAILYPMLEFKDCIGAGGFGKVYRGFWLHEEKKKQKGEITSKKDYELVAIKEARVEGDRDDLLATIKENVLQEAKLFWMFVSFSLFVLRNLCWPFFVNKFASI